MYITSDGITEPVVGPTIDWSGDSIQVSSDELTDTVKVAVVPVEEAAVEVERRVLGQVKGLNRLQTTKVQVVATGPEGKIFDITPLVTVDTQLQYDRSTRVLSATKKGEYTVSAKIGDKVLASTTIVADPSSALVFLISKSNRSVVLMSTLV